MSESALIDQTALDALLDSVGGDAEFVRELVAEYLDDSPCQFAAMRQALADGDADALRRAAHSVKSNSATFGAINLSRMCRELEYTARDGVLTGAAERIAQAEAAFGHVGNALQGATEE